MADDFAAPFYQFHSAGPGAISALKHGWNNAYGGVNFRILGMPFGSFIHFLYVDLASRFGVQISTSYFITKLFVYLGIGIVGAVVCDELLRLTGKTLSYWTILFISSTVIFVTLQNHGMWSNDPVSGYPLAGFGSVILGLAVFAFALRTLRLRITGSRIVVLTFLTTTSVLYYELNVGIVIGIAPLLAIKVLRQTSNGQITFITKTSKLILVSVPCIVPAILLLLGRILSRSSSQLYGGTTISLGSRAIHTFLKSLTSTLPGSAWALSSEFLGGSIGLVRGVIPIVGLLVLVVATFLYSESKQKRVRRAIDKLLITAGLAALLIYWLVGVGVQSITSKVQNESLEIGYVYTYYAIGATVVALLISLAILYYGSSLRIKSSIVAVTLLLTLVGTCQLTVNWRLMEKMYTSFEPNRALIATFSSHSDIPQRCRALQNWTSGGWPAYYEEGMTNGLQSAYLHYHDEEFCPNFVMPSP